MNNQDMVVQPLTREGFAPYGDVIESAGRDSLMINNDMAERFHALAEVQVEGANAHAIISLVHSKKFQLPRRVDHVEHHPLGSQAFLPIDETPFIVVVARPCETPRSQDLEAFVTNGLQGINYHIGTWHHVLLTPFAATRFLCVDRQGGGNNCIDFFFDPEQQRLLEYKA